jgi:hypothetical protein
VTLGSVYREFGRGDMVPSGHEVTGEGRRPGTVKQGRTHPKRRPISPHNAQCVVLVERPLIGSARLLGDTLLNSLGSYDTRSTEMRLIW